MTAAPDLTNYRPSADEVARNMDRVQRRALNDALQVIARHPEFRLLRRIDPGPYKRPIPAGTRVKRGMFVDCETTGLDVAHDKIIELSLVPFTYGLDGTLYEAGGHYHGLEDPGQPLTEEIQKLTGLADERLKGHRLDDLVIQEVASACDLFVAHNADFDRKMVERRLGATFRERPWACTQEDVPWHDLLGVRSKKLDYLLMVGASAFHEAHGATADCYAALHLIGLPAAVPLPGAAQTSYLGYLLDSARTPRSRVWATGAPFETKDYLKRRGYRWNAGDDGRLKAWWKDINDDAIEEERAWLRSTAHCNAPRIIKVTAYDRYSVRA